MAQKTVMERVEKLEQTVESLVALPGVVADLAVRTGNLESQFLQLRSEMRDGFSSIRDELSGTRSELKGEITGLRGELKGEITGLRGELRGEISGLRGEVADLRLGLAATRFEVTTLAEKVDQLGTNMRSLHEEVIDRITLLHEGRPALKPRRRRKR